MRLVIAPICVALAIAACPAAATAGTIIHFDTSMGDFEVELYDSQTPATAANFLAYTDSGAYDNTFIHRSVPGFVIQGGGYGLVGNNGFFVQPLAPVVNEPGISNTRGTIAMAKLGGDPNSATSQWFFNLVDNTFLDDPSNNGGYTAFGQVLGNGMDVVDAIARLQVYDASSIYSAFDEIPLTGPYFDTAHLVMINSVSVVSLLPGDADRNGIVDMKDYAIWFTNFNCTAASWEQGDFNGDGIVDMKDYAIWFSHFNQTGSSQWSPSDMASPADGTADAIPEPSTLTMFALGLAALIRRRRK